MKRPNGVELVRRAEAYRDARIAVHRSIDLNNAAIGRVTDAEQTVLAERCAKLSAAYDRCWHLLICLFEDAR